MQDRWAWGTTLVMITLTGLSTGTLLYGHVGAGILTAMAAFVSGVGAACLFGHKGVSGGVLAVLGACFATGFCPAMIGVLMGRPNGAFIALWDVFASLIYQPIAGFVWAILMTTTHLIAKHLRTRRFATRNIVFNRRGHIPALIDH